MHAQHYSLPQVGVGGGALSRTLPVRHRLDLTGITRSGQVSSDFSFFYNSCCRPSGVATIGYEWEHTPDLLKLVYWNKKAALSPIVNWMSYHNGTSQKEFLPAPFGAIPVERVPWLSAYQPKNDLQPGAAGLKIVFRTFFLFALWVFNARPWINKLQLL